MLIIKEKSLYIFELRNHIFVKGRKNWRRYKIPQIACAMKEAIMQFISIEHAGYDE